jgi:hypothetical protein
MNPTTIVAGALGLSVFFLGLWSSRRFKDDPDKVKLAFWFTLLGAALLDTSTYALRASAFIAHLGGVGPVFFAWSYTAMMVLIVGAKTFLPPGMMKRIVK